MIRFHNLLGEGASVLCSFLPQHLCKHGGRFPGLPKDRLKPSVSSETHTVVFFFFCHSVHDWPAVNEQLVAVVIVASVIKVPLRDYERNPHDVTRTPPKSALPQ